MKLTRELYLKQIRPYYDSDIIKVITGVRRAGKSILLNSIQQEIAESGVDDDHIIYINLENIDYAYISDAFALNDEIKSRIADKNKYYIFLDEIQHVADFEKAIASFRASLNVSLFVTGSNSKLLSGELSTLLTGRTVEFEVMPFSFYEVSEYLRINNRAFNEDMIYEYIKWGGFPLRFDFDNDAATIRYIKNLYESIINRDILTQTAHIDRKAFKDISLYILSNAGKEFSAENVAAYYSEKSGHSISSRTVNSYIDKMKAAYLLHGVNRFNLVGKMALSNREKYYSVDMGFRTINTNTVNYEDTFFLENIVYNELLIQGFEVFTGKTYKSEIDFVAIKNGKKCFIQVSYLLASESTIQREFGAFSPISDASPKYVLSLDKIDLSRNGIAHVNIVDFLLHRCELAVT